MAQNPTHPPLNLHASDLIAELKRQRLATDKLSFEVQDLRHVVIAGPVDLIALAQVAAETVGGRG
jgi:hypothetical protein